MFTSLFSITRNCWITGTLENGTICYGDSPRIFCESLENLLKLAKSISDSSNDEIQIYELLKSTRIGTTKPSSNAMRV